MYHNINYNEFFKAVLIYIYYKKKLNIKVWNNDKIN